MQFQDAYEFVKVFGSGMTLKQLSHRIGISTTSAARLASACDVLPLKLPLTAPGLDHLPGLPEFTVTRTWAGGTWYRIDCRQAGDSPGYRSLLIHQSKQNRDDTPEEDAP